MANKKKRGLNISNNMLAGVLIVAIAISAIGLSVSVSQYVTGKTTDGTTTVTLTEVTNCTLETHTVAFGNITPGSSNDTTDGNPAAFDLDNNGNANANVTVTTGAITELFNGSATASDAQFNCTATGGTGTCQVTSWTDSAAAEQDLIWNLSPTNGQDNVWIEVKISPPDDEPVGPKIDTWTITCS